MEGLGTLGRLVLEGLLLFVYPNLLSSGSITTWRAAERFFVEFFNFLFDNISVCYLVFAFYFPLLLCFTFIICCSCLCTRVVSVDCTSFTIGGLNHLTVIFNWGSKQALVFLTHYRAFNWYQSGYTCFGLIT